MRREIRYSRHSAKSHLGRRLFAVLLLCVVLGLTAANAGRLQHVVGANVLATQEATPSPMSAAGTQAMTTTNPPTLIPITETSPLSVTLPLLGKSAALLDMNTHQWVYLSNADTQYTEASTTKIMTALVAIKYGHLNTVETIKPMDLALAGNPSTMGLWNGDRLTLRQLLDGLLLVSGNDAAHAIARIIGGSAGVPGFVALMNDEARALHLNNTFYQTVDGYADDDHLTLGHHSTARDLVLLAAAAMTNDTFRSIVRQSIVVLPRTHLHQEYVLVNEHWFITYYPGADGVKPGWTGHSGFCLVLSAKRNGRWLIGAVMGTPTLYADPRNLMDYGFGVKSDDQTGTPAAVGVWLPNATASHAYLTFPATRLVVRGSMLDFYLKRGGGAQIGPPLSTEIQTRWGSKQYFDRAVFDWNRKTGLVSHEPLGAMAAPAWIPVTYGSLLKGAILAAYKADIAYDSGIGFLGWSVTSELPLDCSGSVIQFFRYGAVEWTPQNGVTILPLGLNAFQHGGTPVLTLPHTAGGNGCTALK